jgi:ABC-type branched-subunit amino acid transport system ATPase component
MARQKSISSGAKNLSMSDILVVKDLHLSVGKASILNGVDLTVRDGEMVGIVGPNGSGKTTLFNALSGFLESSAGSIRFLNHDVTRLAASDRALLGMGRTFQNFGVFKEMTVEENIVIALESRKSWLRRLFTVGTPAAYRAEALKLLQLVALESKIDDRASSLSGGQMRLLEIIRTLAFGASLFLLDEPTAGVSPKMKDDVATVIRGLKKQGKTVLIIEHDINFIYQFCDRIVVLESGRVAMDGTPEVVRADPRLQEIYFGHKRV